jgi:hypothetical protein
MVWRVSLEPVPAMTGPRPATASSRAEHRRLLGVRQGRRLARGAGYDQAVRPVVQKADGQLGQAFMVDLQVRAERRDHGSDDRAEVRSHHALPDPAPDLM